MRAYSLALKYVAGFHDLLMVIGKKPLKQNERTHFRELLFIIIIILIAVVQQWIERVVPKIIQTFNAVHHTYLLHVPLLGIWRKPFS